MTRQEATALELKGMPTERGGESETDMRDKDLSRESREFFITMICVIAFVAFGYIIETAIRSATVRDSAVNRRSIDGRLPASTVTKPDSPSEFH